MTSISLSGVTVTFRHAPRSGRSLRAELASFVSAVGGNMDESKGAVEVRALDDISLRISPGERVGLIGPNGAGKTTLLRVMARVFKPSKGSATIEGRTFPIFSTDLGMAPSASGLENIYLRGYLLGLNHGEIEERIREIAEFSELGPYLAMPVETYSPGMSARLAFSITTSISPEILILDEWLSAGDLRFVKKAEARMRALMEQSQILVLATHRAQILSDIATRIILLDHGSIVADGEPEEVLELYHERYS